MSSVKTPQEKKRKSYARDCRNSYGENAKASRKKIPRGKQRAHMNERRTVSEILRVLVCAPGPSAADGDEEKARSRGKLKRLGGFKKYPDLPLGQYLLRRKARKKTRNRRGVICRTSKASGLFPPGPHPAVGERRGDCDLSCCGSFPRDLRRPERGRHPLAFR